MKTTNQKIKKNQLYSLEFTWILEFVIWNFLLGSCDLRFLFSRDGPYAAVQLISNIKGARCLIINNSPWIVELRIA